MSDPVLEATQRRLSEQRFHDEQAAERAASFRAGRADLRFEDAAFLDHETWIRPAFEMLGNLRGKCVLDYGCGHGMAAITLARAGATVTAFDLSPGYVQEAEERSLANGVTVHGLVADGESLPFADATFDAVWGNAILHHLDWSIAGPELYRVLKPGGVAVFCEPWGGNPLLRFARRFLPYPGKDRTPDERPLQPSDIPPMRQIFPDLHVRGFQLFGMLRRVWPNRTFARTLDGIDRRLLTAMPFLENRCRYVVLTLTKS